MNRQRIILLSVFTLVFLSIATIVFLRTYTESHERFRIGLPIPKNILPTNLLSDAELVGNGTPQMPEIREREMTLSGTPESPVTMMVFGDFQSDLSRKQAQAIEESIAELQAESDVRVIWRDLPNLLDHSRAFISAVSARCAGEQGAFRKMHDLIFFEATNYDEMEFLRFARKINVKEEAFTICLRDPAHEFRINQDIEEAQTHAITEIPTLFINGELHEGYLDTQALITILRYHLQRVR